MIVGDRRNPCLIPESIASGVIEQDCTSGFIERSLNNMDQVGIEIIFPLIYP